uniref:Putative pentapeptide repeat protein n=1 Tax=Helianthus annuus TaxID=4232 RepID=A0A251TEF4_HELAN
MDIDLTRTDIIKIVQYAVGGRVSLIGVNLSGLDLSKLKLSSVDFSFACLKNVIFSRANLCHSKFQEVDAENTIFHDATVSE